MNRPSGQRWITLQLLIAVALVGCGRGERGASDEDAAAASSIPVGADRDAMATRLAQVREALAAGQPGALDDCLELAERSLSFTDDEPATDREDPDVPDSPEASISPVRGGAVVGVTGHW